MKRLRRVLCVMMAMLMAYNPQLVSAKGKATIANQNIEIGIGETQKIQVENAGKAKYNSDKKSIAKVSKKGVVTGVKPGKAQIRVKAKNKTLKCSVTVKAPYLDEFAIIKVGDISQLNINCPSPMAGYSFSSSDTSVATVDGSGMIVGMSSGTATITMTTTVKKKSYTSNCTVTVLTKDAGLDDSGDPEGLSDYEENTVLSYGITDLRINGSEVSAEVSAPDNCVLLVQFISEDDYFNGRINYIYDLFASGEVKAGTNTEWVTADLNGTLPEHYVAQAVLIDVDKNNLCEPLVNIDHTARHEEFDAKTVNDFSDDETVINFDEQINSNFGVLAGDVETIKVSNIIIEYDKEDILSYTVEGLKKVPSVGQKIYITDGENTGLLSVQSITKKGKSYVIFPEPVGDDELSIKDFYSFLKVDMVVDGQPSPNLEQKQNNNSIEPIEQDAIAIEKTISLNNSGKVGGKSYAPWSSSMSLKIRLEFEYDIHLFGKDYIYVKQTATVGGSLSFKLQISTDDFKTAKEHLSGTFDLVEVHVPTNIPGVTVFVDANFKIEAKAAGALEIKGDLNITKGFSYDSNSGFQKIDTDSSTWAVDAKGTVEIKIGPELYVGLAVLDEVFRAGIDGFMGVKAVGVADVPITGGGDKVHACNLCLSVTVSFDVSIKVKITVFKEDIPVPSYIPSANINVPLYKGHISLLREDDSPYETKWKTGDCKNYKYKVTLTARSDTGAEVSTPITVVKINTGKNYGETESGRHTYLYPGDYKATASISGQNVEKTFSVGSSPVNVIVSTRNFDYGIEGGVVDGIENTPVAGVFVEVYAGLEKVDEATTDNSGKFSIPVNEGGKYKVYLTKDGYERSAQEVTVDRGMKQMGAIRLRPNSSSLMGGIFGEIKDALTGNGIDGVSVKLYKGWDQDPDNTEPIKEYVTNGYGSYDARKTAVFGIDVGLWDGNYTIYMEKDGYIPMRRNLSVIGGKDTEYNYTISPEGSENVYRVVLTWGEYPYDLDSHLNGIVDGQREHVYFSSTQGAACWLDTDDTSSYGPETITIPDLNRFTGGFVYSVHDYSNRGATDSDQMSYSGATIELYKGPDLLDTFYIPTGQTATVWNVFMIDNAENVTILNTFENVDSPGDVTGGGIIKVVDENKAKQKSVDAEKIVDYKKPAKKAS